MHDMSTQYALQAIFDISIGISLHDVSKDHESSFVEAMDFVFAHLADRLMAKPYYRYFWWCMPSEYEIRRSEQVIINLVDDILRHRLQETDQEIKPRSDIMSLFIKKERKLTEEEQGGGGRNSVLSIETFRSIFMTFLSAGKGCTLYTLSLYPDVQQKLYDEMPEQLKRSQHITYNDLKGFEYLNAVANKTMRLYPAFPSSFKVAVQDDCLPDGTFIPAGAKVAYCPWHMGRNNPVFRSSGDVLEFKPERWLEMKTWPSAYDHPAFLAGPRICIGMNMVLIEVKVFVAVMVHHFEIAIQKGEKMEDRGYILSPTLVMDGGLPLHMAPRLTLAATAQ